MRSIKKVFLTLTLLLIVFHVNLVMAQAATVGKAKVSSVEQTDEKQITISWKKVSGAKGYALQYRVKGGTYKTKETTKRTLTIKKLKVNKTYQFRVRAYTMDSGTKKYGKYSAVKSLKVKKLAEPFSAAGKGYTINNGNTNVYSNTSLKSKIGAIYASDEVTVNWFNNSVANVTYPISKGTKTGYVPVSAMLTQTYGPTYTAKAKVTTYRRPGGASYGYIAVGDAVGVLGTSGGYVQVRYPVSGGYKYAFITNSDLAKIKGKTITSFSQMNASWKDVKYGYSDASKKTVAYLGKGASGNVGSGCGVLALTNAVYYLNGTFIQPSAIASYSLSNGYRINGTGTAYGLYKSFANNRGKTYGIAWVEETSDWNKLQTHLSSGRVAICGKSGHIMALVDYDPSTQKFLLLDSVPSSNRGTQGTGYVWATKSYLVNTVGIRSDFHVLKSTK